MNREYNLQCYLNSSPVLREAIEYVFEPYGQDKVTVLSRDHGAEIFLDKDARKWATMLVKQQNEIAQLNKQVRGLKSVTAAYIKVGIAKSNSWYSFILNVVRLLVASSFIITLLTRGV